MPPAAVPTTLHNWHHDDADEAKKEIMAAVGDLDKFEVFGSQVLIGVYVRPVKTRGGIITPGSASKEDIWQNKSGLVLKVGPTAFNAERLEQFNGRAPMVGEWIYHDVKQCFQAHLKGPKSKKSATRDWEGWPIRLVYGADIFGRTPEPQVVV